MSDQIDVNQLSNAIQQKVDLPSGKSQADIDYVVESQLPTAANSYTWYRLYKSGWVEQGGIVTISRQNANSALDTNVNLPIQMEDSNYYIAPITFIEDGGNSTGLRNFRFSNSTSSVLVIGTYSTTAISNNYKVCWEIKGMSAQGGIS